MQKINRLDPGALSPAFQRSGCTFMIICPFIYNYRGINEYLKDKVNYVNSRAYFTDDQRTALFKKTWTLIIEFTSPVFNFLYRYSSTIYFSMVEAHDRLFALGLDRHFNKCISFGPSIDPVSYNGHISYLAIHLK